ncbi:hypothetical protein [Lichenibacterium dinghuense]|uniref:hypothetical protein n=1 Tax=Lichenibacterium dinghuense TaxID=2895977 RepID=UPI001F1EAAA9|nr:hypothetical protein [Lichenibacterium sp. 6Y81]
MTAPAGGAGRGGTLLILLGALTFNAALCLANTVAVHVTDSGVMGAEVVLILAALALALRRDPAPYLVLAVFLSYAALLMALRPLLDLKAARDFLIPITFYALGRRWSDPRLADRAALASGLVVLAFGLFEATALDTYTRFFNIAQYYVARGSAVPVDAAQSEFGTQASALFTSGIRPDARTILPFLGPHRTSSVFLEPVSMGNFGAILYLWSLCRPGMAHRRLVMALGAAAIVLADARFGLYVCAAGTGTCFIGSRLPRFVWFALPFAMLAGFAVYGFTSTAVDWSNDIGGRMLWTARLLTSLSDGAVWGLSPDKPFLSDSGYAYSLNQIGLVGVAGFWALFVFLPERNPAAWRFRCGVATYVCLLLVISDSVYSIKTGALLWFMLGSSDGAPAAATAERRRPAHARIPAAAVPAT